MLSVIIPAKNEIYLEKTIRNVLENAEGEIEVIAELDGYIPNPQIIINDPRVIFVHHKEGIGQRACTNHGVSIAKGKYIMKLDAHCAVDKGFDVKLATDCEPDWTIIPRMYCLDIETWKPKLNKRVDYMYISSPTAEQPFRAMYYNNSQPKNDKLIDDTMACMGPGWFMHKSRFIEQGGCDEKHGSWGAMSVEVSLKAWLSGGALKVNKKTWFAHWFRTGGTSGFPYPLSGSAVEKARAYSRDLWLNDKWDKATRKLQWVVDKFNPPGWSNNDLTIIFYTANVISKKILEPVIRNLKEHSLPIVSISQEPMELGNNIVVPKERSLQNIYRQVLEGAKKATTKYVALCEDDCLYIPEHFKYRPKKAPFAYNLNRWLLHLNEKLFSYRKRPILSQCIADRKILIKNLEERFTLPLIPDKYCGEMGCFEKQLGMTEYEYETFETKEPNLVICHNRNTMGRKYIGKDDEPKTELAPWGKVEYWVDKFKEEVTEEKKQIDDSVNKEVPKNMITELNRLTYHRLIKERQYPRWRGHSILKNPADLILYQQVIFENKPDFIIETGTKFGGSAIYFADICELIGKGQVITIDIAPVLQPLHKRITYITGNSIDKELVEKVKNMVGNGSVMVVLDSKHRRAHVKWELYLYSKLVTQGQYIVVEDCYKSNMEPDGVMEARDWFLSRTKRFKLVDLSNQFLIGVTRDGWIKKL